MATEVPFFIAPEFEIEGEEQSGMPAPPAAAPMLAPPMLMGPEMAADLGPEPAVTFAAPVPALDPVQTPGPVPFALPFTAPALPEAPLAPDQSPTMAERETRIAGTLDRTRAAYAPAETAAQVVRDFDDAKQELGRRWLDVQRKRVNATDPAEIEQLTQQAAEIESQHVAMETGRRQARLDADAALVQGDAEVEVAGQELAVLRREQAAEEIGRERLKRRAQVDQLKSDRAAAETRVRERRDSATALLRAQVDDDTSTTWASVASLIGELTSAYAQRRVPNLDGAIQSVLTLGRERLSRQREAAGAEVESAEADLSDIGRSLDDIAAEGAATDVAILEQAQAALDLELAKARGTPREVAVFRAQQAVADATAKANNEALAKQTEAESKRRQAEAEIQLKQAQARKAMAEAAKLERRGMGGGQGTGTNTIAPHVVTMPGTSDVLATFPKTAAGRAAATKAREVVGASAAGLRVLNEYLADIEDYGERGLFDRNGWAKSPEMAALETNRQAIIGPLAKVYAGGFNPSINMEERAEQAVAFPEGWWQREGTARASVEALIKQAEDGFRENASVAGLAPAAVEEMIRQRRALAFSKRDARNKLMKDAEKVLADPKRDPRTRVAAVEALTDRLRTETPEGSTGNAWVPAAIRELQNVLPTLDDTQDKRVKAAVQSKLTELQKLWSAQGSGATLQQEIRQRQGDAASLGMLPSGI